MVTTHIGKAEFINSSPLDKMAAILADDFQSAFSSMKNTDFQIKFHWSLFLRVQSTTIQF